MPSTLAICCLPRPIRWPAGGPRSAPRRISMREPHTPCSGLVGTDEALLWLEQGKTRLLNETLALGAVDLAALPEDQRRLPQEVARRYAS